MLKLIPFDRLRFFLNRLQERLWVKPLGACLLSVLSISIASFIDGSAFAQDFPEVSLSSVEALLQVLTGGMLVIATFAVGTMVSAYGSASRTATPRSFSVVVSDDISQNALSVFTGSFIFSIVGLAALKNGLLDGPGRTVLFGLTLYNYGLVIYSFVRWVDSIARLGRLGNTIAKVEEATQLSFDRNCGGAPIDHFRHGAARSLRQPPPGLGKSPTRKHPAQPEEEAPYDRVRVPQISVQNLFEDAFTSLSRDGAANLEVGLRLQTTLAALSRLDHPDFQKAAKSQAEQALARAEQQISYPPDFEKIQQSFNAFW